MNSERLRASELILNAALLRDFTFTLKQAMSYAVPKLAGPIPRKEAIVRNAIKRALECEILYQDGDFFKVALPDDDDMVDLEINYTSEVKTVQKSKSNDTKKQTRKPIKCKMFKTKRGNQELTKKKMSRKNIKKCKKPLNKQIDKIKKINKMQRKPLKKTMIKCSKSSTTKTENISEESLYKSIKAPKTFEEAESILNNLSTYDLILSSSSLNENIKQESSSSKESIAVCSLYNACKEQDLQKTSQTSINTIIADDEPADKNRIENTDITVMEWINDNEYTDDVEEEVGIKDI